MKPEPKHNPTSPERIPAVPPETVGLTGSAGALAGSCAVFRSINYQLSTINSKERPGRACPPSDSFWLSIHSEDMN